MLVTNRGMVIIMTNTQKQSSNKEVVHICNNKNNQIYHSTSLSQWFTILDKYNFVKLSYYKGCLLKLGLCFLMKILQNGSQDHINK